MRIEKINGIRYNHDAPCEDGKPTRLITEVTYPDYNGERHELSHTAWFMNDGDMANDTWPLEIFPSTLHAPCKDRINFLETLRSYNRPVVCTNETAAKLVAKYGGRLTDYGRLLDATDTYVWTPDTFDGVLTAPVDDC